MADKFIPFILIITSSLFAQSGPILVNYTMSHDATTYTNSHKIVAHGSYESIIYITYHSSDSVFYTYSSNGGGSWSTPVFVGLGKNPAIDIDKNNNHHIAWTRFVSNNYEIFYDCIEDINPPVNITNTPGNSTLPDLIVDTSLTVHFTWTENVGASNQIFYRTYKSGILGDTLRISDIGDNNQSSISIFDPYKLYIIWGCKVTSPSTRYYIFYRFKEIGWSLKDSLRYSSCVCRCPSFDFSHGEDVFGTCWEDSMATGNLEPVFYGGNGGTFGTSGRSRFPVMSTVANVWSYLFVQEDSIDILYRLYYFMSGWGSVRSLRTDYNISEPVRFPNCIGDKLVWTQGNNAPYKIYFMKFGYPISVHEGNKKRNEENLLEIFPNPTSKFCVIHSTQNIENIKIYNVTGVLVKGIEQIKSNEKNIKIDLLDISLGIYFLQFNFENNKIVRKVIIQ